MDQPQYDLWYDATTVNADLVVDTCTSQGPRSTDATFDPQPGDWVTVGDDEEPSLRARATRGDGNKVWVQVDLDMVASDATFQPAGHS